MIKHRQNEVSSESNSTDENITAQQVDPSLSPTTRRKHEFRLARLQSEVMTRAKSTFFGLGDVWKSKISSASQPPTSTGNDSTSTLPRSPKNQNTVKNTFEFFFPKKSRETTNTKIRKGNSENNLNLSQRSKSTNGRSKNIEKQLKSYKSDLKTETKSFKNLKRDERSRRFSRNQSVDISEFYPINKRHNINNEKNVTEALSRSFDDGIQHLSEGSDDFRPRSYNDTFSFLDEFDNETRSIYDEDFVKRQTNSKNNEKSINSSHSRHILFNDEDDVIFFKSSSCPDKSTKKSERYTSIDPFVKSMPNSKDIPGILHTRGSSQIIKSQDHGIHKKTNSRSKDSKDQSLHTEKVISARLKIQPPGGNESNSNDSINTSELKQVQNKLLAIPKNDLCRHETLNNNFYEKPTQPSSSHPNRSISTVIIEEQERLITPYENEPKMHHKTNAVESEIKGNNKISKMQQSLDMQCGHSSTLPRNFSYQKNKNNNEIKTKSKWEGTMPSLSSNKDENKLQRCSSVDLDLEVINISYKLI